ncbi:unnamed protein product [Linum trigynum]|uniref:Rhomboid protein n=1 Tax=Linum trigynum TaxID=586398 RepID=A0AAV2G0J5_9ROSI
MLVIRRLRDKMRQPIFRAAGNRLWRQVQIERGFHCICLSTGKIQSLGGSVYLFSFIENENILFYLVVVAFCARLRKNVPGLFQNQLSSPLSLLSFAVCLMLLIGKEALQTNVMHMIGFICGFGAFNLHWTHQVQLVSTKRFVVYGSTGNAKFYSIKGD